jgi:DNA-binding XRE family transcriptional regulator
MTQEQFAKTVGVSERAVIRWEKGESDPMPAVRRSLDMFDDLRLRLINRYDDQGARRWLRRPNRALRGNTPLEVLIASGPVPVRDIVVGPEAGAYR